VIPPTIEQKRAVQYLLTDDNKSDFSLSLDNPFLTRELLERVLAHVCTRRRRLPFWARSGHSEVMLQDKIQRMRYHGEGST
jgi:hypothetical protein